MIAATDLFNYRFTARASIRIRKLSPFTINFLTGLFASLSFMPNNFAIFAIRSNAFSTVNFNLPSLDIQNLLAIIRRTVHTIFTCHYLKAFFELSKLLCLFFIKILFNNFIFNGYFATVLRTDNPAHLLLITCQKREICLETIDTALVLALQHYKFLNPEIAITNHTIFLNCCLF